MIISDFVSREHIFPKNSEAMTFEKLIACGSVTLAIRNLLKELIEAKFNIFISGEEGSGKTTFLNALANFIPNDERVITIEDTAELQIRTAVNLVRLETRNAKSIGEDEITIQQLIKSALHMCPERIVFGEVRGAEAFDMLQAMNTGQNGSLATGHAHSTNAMINRLETMVMTGAKGMSLSAIRQQIASAIDLIIHLSRMRDKSRKIVSICEIDGLDDKGNVRLNTLFEFVENEETKGSKKLEGRLVRTKNQMNKKHSEKLEAAGKRILQV